MTLTLLQAVKNRGYYATNPVEKLTKRWLRQVDTTDRTLIKHGFVLVDMSIDWGSLSDDDGFCAETQRLIDWALKQKVLI